MTEIELKAHISDPDAAEKAVLALPGARKIGETVKWDEYLRLEGSPVRVRLRDENDTITLTYKRKETRNGLEVNDEQECTVSDRKTIEVLLADIGFKPFLTKIKRTRSFTVSSDCGNSGESVPAVTAEISLVEPLGWFLELEILLEETDPDEKTIEKARKRLLQVLADCGVGEESIEHRYYSEMLG